MQKEEQNEMTYYNAQDEWNIEILSRKWMQRKELQFYRGMGVDCKVWEQYMGVNHAILKEKKLRFLCV